MVCDPILTARCADVLRQEIALLGRLAATQEVVRNAVFAREWNDLESVLARLCAYGEEFALLEAERERVFREMGGEGRSVNFYAAVADLDPVARRELCELYRHLKLDSLKVKLANDALNHYIQNARMTITGFLEAAFPDRKGKLYTRRGVARSSDLRSLVLNQSL